MRSRCERLIERARAGESGGAALEQEVRQLVDREAGSLPGVERDALCRRVLLLATGLILWARRRKARRTQRQP